MEHCGPVLCCMWSPLDPDFIITGSADFTIRIWKVAYNLPQKKLSKKILSKTKEKENKTNKNISIENNLLEVTKATSECSISDVSQTVQSIKIILIKIIKIILLQYK